MYFAAPIAELAGHVLGDVARPAFGSVEGDDADRSSLRPNSASAVRVGGYCPSYLLCKVRLAPPRRRSRARLQPLVGLRTSELAIPRSAGEILGVHILGVHGWHLRNGPLPLRRQLCTSPSNFRDQDMIGIRPSNCESRNGPESGWDVGAVQPQGEVVVSWLGV